MAEYSLVAEPRTEGGSSASRRLRVAGRIPAVVYGHGVAPKAVSVDARALRAALSTDAGVNVLLNLDLGKERHLAIARELQRHPVRHTVSHVDFQVVRADELITAEVALNLVGEALGVTRTGGNIEHLVTSVHVRAKANDIPTSFEVDISELAFGDTIRLGTLDMPPGVTLEGDPETALVVAHAPRTATAEEVEAEAAAAADSGATGETESQDEN